MEITTYNKDGDPIDSSLYYDKDGILYGIAIHKVNKELYINWLNYGIFDNSKYKMNYYYKCYDSKGVILFEGLYYNNHKLGVWKYYENGKFKKEVSHKQRGK